MSCNKISADFFSASFWESGAARNATKRRRTKRATPLFHSAFAAAGPPLPPRTALPPPRARPFSGVSILVPPPPPAPLPTQHAARNLSAYVRRAGVRAPPPPPLSISVSFHVAQEPHLIRAWIRIFILILKQITNNVSISGGRAQPPPPPAG